MSARKIAYASTIVALSFLMLYLGSLIEVLDLCVVLLASFLLYISLLESNSFYIGTIVISTFVISILLLPNKLIPIEYLLFGGFYPIVKIYVERLNKIFAYTLKILYFNAVLTGLILISNYVLQLPIDYGYNFSILAYLLGNIFFIISDLAYTSVKKLYFFKLRDKIKLYKFIRK